MQYFEYATNFDDMIIKQNPAFRDFGHAKNPDLYCKCSKCKGYGGWNLRLNAYGDGRHFQMHCSECNGWGWIEKKHAHCSHEFVSRSIGMCVHEKKCKHCGKTHIVDSSD